MADMALNALGKNAGAGMPVTMDAIVATGWNILREDLLVPVAVFKDRALRRNRAWMCEYLNQSGALFAPQGETTNDAVASPAPVPPQHRVVRLSDQHCYLDVPPFEVGDMIDFGLSQPCMTFDKWRVIHRVDDDDRVIGSLRSYF